MFVVVVHFQVKPGHEESFRAAVLQQAINSLENEEPCRQFDVCFDPDDASRVLLYEVYDDLAAFDAHRETPYFAEFFATVDPWVAEKELSTWTRDKS